VISDACYDLVSKYKTFATKASERKY